jgi:hypothetical protein
MQSRARTVIGSAGSWARHVLAGLVLVAPAAAQGNVQAFVDAQGNLRVLGDEQSNGLVLLYERPSDELVVQGVGGTTVNGLPELRPIVPGAWFVFVMGDGDDSVRFGRFDDGGCCNDRDIIFDGGEGDDSFRVGDEEGSLDRVFADMGPGNDRFWAGEGGLIGPLDLRMGVGDDVLDGFYSFMSAGATVDLGPGNDLVDFVEHVAREAFTIEGGEGADTILFEATYLRDALVIATGGGDDLVEVVEITESALLGGSLAVDTGDGADRIRLVGLLETANGITVAAGNDADVVTIEAAQVSYAMGISLGTGDDRLQVQASTFTALAPAVFDGAEGTDRYAHLDRSTFAVPPDLLRFEGPKAARLTEPSLVTSTTFAGRVVLRSGEVVPAASIAVPELGIQVTSAADGTFEIPVSKSPYTRLDLTVGATVRGRRHAALLSARPVAEAAAELGDVLVVPTHSTVLVFGDGAQDARALEQRLLSLGRDPGDILVRRFLPQDLAAFEVIWHVASATPLTLDERARLTAFVRSGGGLHLAGEASLVQVAHEALVNELIVDPDVDIVSQGFDEWFPIAYGPQATGALALWPNALGLVSDFYGGRRIDGVDPENAFILGASGQVFAAAWGGRDLAGGRGRLSLGLITLWLAAANNLDAIENLQTFLQWEPDGFSVR